MTSFLVAALAIRSASAAGRGGAGRTLEVSSFEFYSTHTAVSLTVTGSGVASLTTAGPRVESSRRLPRVAIDSVLRAVDEAQFVDLDPQQGRCFVDMTMREVRVRIDGKGKTVTLCTFEPEKMSAEARAQGVRALRVWIAVRALFPQHSPEGARHEVDALLDGE